jgi:hypothetical protein
MPISQKLLDSLVCRIKARAVGAARLALIPVFLCGILAAIAPSADAAVAAAPGWTIDSLPIPPNFTEQNNSECVKQLGTGAQYPHCNGYDITAINVGSKATDGTPITMSATMPAGVKVRRVSFLWSGAGRLGDPELSSETDLNTKLPTPLCTNVPLSCTLPPVAVAPNDRVRMLVYVTLEPSAADPIVSTASVSGGGAPEARDLSDAPDTEAEPLFGYKFGSLFVNPAGAPVVQAGEHPSELATRIDFNTKVIEGEYRSVQEIRDAIVDLPLGMVGSAVAAPTCTLAQLTAETCPPDSVVGHVFTEPTDNARVDGPLNNVTPEHGKAAEFGFIDTLGAVHLIYASVAPTPAGYVLRAATSEIPQVGLTDLLVTFFGDPAAVDGSGNTPVPQLTAPSSCTGQPLLTHVYIDRWVAPGRENPDGTPDLTDPNWLSQTSESPAVSGCNLLRFNPSISATPEVTRANSPSGFNVDIEVPEHEDPSTLATPPLKKAVVTLPAGVSVNPSSANGLAACSLAQVGMSASGEPNAGPPSCPDASKIGALELDSPAISGTLQGSVYLARQNENPFGSLLALYFVVNDPERGVLVKLAGRVEANPLTGQLTTVVDNSPQFPFSALRVHIFGGEKASLRTPLACGSYATTSELTPWSAPDSGPPATPGSAFNVSSAADGSACPAAIPFSPSMSAGTSSNRAGAFSPFTVTIARTDAEQELGGVTVTTPEGLLGLLKSVEQCLEPQAGRGECGPNSLVGSATVGAGSGSDPFYIRDGKVFLTGPYHGAPFGLSIVVPAIAGPFNLGNVVVRSRIEVDPHTARVSVISDPLPQMINSIEGLRSGIPTDLRSVTVSIDRPGFIFNPSSCDPLTGDATLTGVQGAGATVSSHFQASDCGALKFAPKFTASTAGKASKANGASLDVKVGYPTGPQGTYANIKAVKVDLPKQLPSRLTTLQKACLAAMFEANPASCPHASDVGTATATTPVLNVALTGPAYLVSHGGEAFPDLEIVLQGENITLILIGNTQIKKGITSSTFKTVPDAPVSSFELKLPTGPFSILGATVPQSKKYNLCGQTLPMPTQITAQNGAVIKQTTKIAITGCPKSKKAAAKKKKKKTKGDSGKGKKK